MMLLILRTLYELRLRPLFCRSIRKDFIVSQPACVRAVQKQLGHGIAEVPESFMIVTFPESGVFLSYNPPPVG